jgi:excisionase family DNA binding protein
MMSIRPEVSIDLSDAVLELIAEKVAEILDARGDRDEPEPWIGVAEAAEHLHCKPQRIYALVHQRRLKPRRDGARLLFRRSELDVWLATGGASHTRPPHAPSGVRKGR